MTSIYSSFIASIIVCTFLSSCENSLKTGKDVPIKIEKDNDNIVDNLAKKPKSWIEERIKKAQQTLSRSEGGKLVWQSIEAHGGLKKWFSNGPISFRFDYVPTSEGIARKSIQQIDTWSNKSRHADVLDSNDIYGWDGNNAWVQRNDTLNFDYNLRFWALTPYFFLGQPFIFDGDGVITEKLEDQMLLGSKYDVVKISFESGTGDAPDDYYINLYDKETHLLKAIKYIVSYPSYFKDGGHSPEKTMIISDYVTVDGITLSNSYQTYALAEEGEELGQMITNVTVSDIKFLPNLENSHFEIPEGAKIITEL